MANYNDLTGKRFGKLIVIKRVGSKNSSPTWECKCDCGNTKIVSSKNLIYGLVKSCGCLREDFCKNELREKYQEYRVEGTNVAFLKSKKLNSNNKSGVRGVHKNKRGKWRAEIVFKKKWYHLGVYDKFEDAVKARKEAEERLFKPIIEKYEKK